MHFQVLVQIADMRIMEIIANTTNRIAEGEVLQLIEKSNPQTSEENYMRVITNKTAILFQAAAQCGAILSKSDSEIEEALRSFGMQLGLAYQLIDDVLDYSGTADELGKNVGDDLSEGKSTLPLIYASKNGSTAQREVILESLNAKKLTKDMLDNVIEIVQDCGGIDYTKTFSEKLSLSLGTRYADVNTDNDLQSFGENENNSFELNENQSSQFLIDETILALYSKANASVGKWSFSGGVRYEDSNTDGNSIFMKDGMLNSTVKKRPIKKIFPSASITREISEVLGANLSYSYRIRRPSYSSLNSFAEFLDPYSSSQGNPNLTPSYTNKYQFNLTYEGQPFFAIGYSNTEDAIFELIQQDNTTAQIRQMEVNVENNVNWNFRLFGPLSFIKGVDGFTGFMVINNDFTSQNYSIDLNKWSLIWFTQASYTLPYDINFEVNGNYGTGALEEGVEVSWFADLDLSFGKKFLDDQLKVNFCFT